MDEERESLLRCVQWMRDTPTWMDARVVDAAHGVSLHDIRVLVAQAVAVQAVAESLASGVELEDVGRRPSSLIFDALHDRLLLSALDRVRGTLFFSETTGQWGWLSCAGGRSAVGPDVREVLAQVRQLGDRAVSHGR